MQKLTFLAAFIFLFSTSAFAQTVHGVFRVVKGDVQVFSKNGSSAKAKIGQKVFPSDRIKAGVDSRAKIVMVDKNELNISPDSEIVIENYTYKPEDNQKNVLINVLYGKVRAKVEQKYDDKNKFQIKTPTAVAGVRGTDFITGFNKVERTTQIITFEGRVEFGLPGPGGTILNPVMVNVGEMTTAVRNAPPAKPVEVPKSELQQMDSGSDAGQASGPSAQNNNSGAKGPGNDGNRAPASAGGGSTIVANDLPSSEKAPSSPLTPPINPGPPTLRFQDRHPVPPDILQTKNRQLKITVTNGGP